jgi:MioC protein
MEALFLVITMTGTAEMIAEDIIDAHGTGNNFTLRLVEHAEPSLLRQTRNLVVVSSTYGTGDIPDPGKAFFETLKRHPADLSHIHYAVISLGDSIYKDTFANGGLQWDALLKQCGALQLIEPILLDASGTDSMSGRAVEWAGCWLARAKELDGSRSVAEECCSGGDAA